MGVKVPQRKAYHRVFHDIDERDNVGTSTQIL